MHKMIRKGDVSYDYVIGAGCSDDSGYVDDNVGFLIEVMQSWKQHFEYTAGGLIRGADVKGYGWIPRRV